MELAPRTGKAESACLLPDVYFICLNTLARLSDRFLINLPVFNRKKMETVVFRREAATKRDGLRLQDRFQPGG